MAKGLRAKTEKANKSKLRSRVFSPVEKARKERLSAKLLDLAMQPKASTSDDMSMAIEETATGTSSKKQSTPNDYTYDDEQAMDIDEAEALDARTKVHSRGRVQKKGRSKARAAMVFPIYKKGKRVGSKLSARQHKQSLKPK